MTEQQTNSTFIITQEQRQWAAVRLEEQDIEELTGQPQLRGNDSIGRGQPDSKVENHTQGGLCLSNKRNLYMKVGDMSNLTAGWTDKGDWTITP